MFNDLKPHASMVDSGTAWLGTVPGHWRVTAARAVFAEAGPAGHTDERLLSVTIGRGVVPQAEMVATTGKKDASNLDRSKYKLVEPGDIAYNKMRAWQGAVGLSAHRGIVSPAYVVVRPRGDSGMFLHHLLRTPGFAKEAERWSYGITSDQWSLRPEHFRMITIALPALDEQAAIVRYLAHADRRIDRAITVKRKLIALLDEQKQAIVTHAVTRGIDASCAFEGSDSAWLPVLPVGWRAATVGRLLAEGPTNGISPQVTEEGDLATLSLSAIRDGAVRAEPLSTKFVERRLVPNVDAYLLHEGDILLVRGNGRLGLVGRPGLVTDPSLESYIYPDLLIRIRVARNIAAEYLVAALTAETTRVQIELAARTAVGTFKVNSADIRSLAVPLPPLDDQRAIVAHIADATATVDAAIDRARREIHLLREFRTRLTSDIVTGQLDVRHIAATLPDLDPEEPADDVGPAEDGLVDESAEFLEDVDA